MPLGRPKHRRKNNIKVTEHVDYYLPARGAYSFVNCPNVMKWISSSYFYSASKET
jgi:hypothetical protein